MKFNINKLRSWGLRYLACDEDGSIFAFQKPPVRHISETTGTGIWAAINRPMPPKRPAGLFYYIDGTTVKVSDEELEKQYRKANLKYWARQMDNHYRELITDCPIHLTWKDEPYDMVEHGLFPMSDLKVREFI